MWSLNYKAGRTTENMKLDSDSTGHRYLVPIISLAEKCQMQEEHCSRMLGRTSNQVGKDALSFTSHRAFNPDYS